MVSSIVVTTISAPSGEASGVTSFVPETWGGVAPASDTSKTAVWGSPAMGNIAMSELTSSSPSGGGTTSAAVNADGPLGKLRWLRAFGGATPRFFAEGGTAQHMLVAARTAAGVDEVWAWGVNSKGQLGIGSTTSFATPVKVAWTPTVNGEVVTALAVGGFHSLMLTTAAGVQRLYAWGLNTYGQLGDGTFTQRTTPVLVAVSGSPTFVSIAAGSYHSVAADSTGAVWVWGCDGGQTATTLWCGDLGLHGTRSVSTPTKLTDESVNQTTVSVTKKGYVDTTNIATYTTSQPGGFAVGDALAISIGDGVLDSPLQRVSHYEQSGFTVTLRFASAHGRKVGDQIYARGLSQVNTTPASLQVVTAVPDETSLTFTTGVSRSIAATPTTTGWIHDSIVKTASSNAIPSSFTSYVTQTRSAVTTGSVTPAVPNVAVTHRGLSATTTAQIWFSGPHSFLVGNNITVAGVNDPADGSQPWDGSFTITAVSNTVGAYWVRYTVTAQPSTIAQEAAPDGASTGLTVPNPTPTAVSYALASNLVTVTTAETHGLRAGNVVTVDLDDDRYDKSSTAIVSVAATTFTYRLNPAVATSNATGTATIIGCFENCPTAPTGVLEVAAGEGFTMARTATGVVTWGTGFTNHYGRLGRNVPTSTLSTRFGAVALPATVDSGVACTPREIAAGPANGLVACDTSDQDTLVGWGYAYFGRTGAGTASVTSTSLAQMTPTEVKACISCANNGTPTSLGPFATTGTNVTTYATFGRALASGEDIVSISQSAGGGYALTDTGRVFTWGDNVGRALGGTRTYATSDGATGTKEQYSKAARLANRVLPVDATGASTTVTTLGATGKCGFVLDDENVMWSWGDCGPSYLSARGSIGRLYGSAVYGMKFDRVDVPSTAKVMFIESTYRYTFVAAASGDAREDVSLWAFGNTSTQVTNLTNYPGDGTTASYLLPAKIDLPYGFDTSDQARALATMSCGELHCLATTNDARVYGWGDVRYGSTTSTYTRAVRPSQSTSVTAYTYHEDITSELATAMGVGALVNPRVAAGTYFSLVVDIGANSTGGRVYGWGRNTGRQASTGTTTTSAIGPTAVTDAASNIVTDAVAVSAGASHSAAIRADGSLITWGSDLYGQLGNGTTSSELFATPALPAGRIAVQVIASGGYTMARLDDGSVIGFGLNRRGVLGNGNITNQTSPVTVLGGHSFAEIDTAGNLRNSGTPSAVGVTADGDVYAWGANDHGQIGRGISASTTSYSTAPVRVLRSTGDGVSGVDAVASGATWNAAFGRFEPLAAPEQPTALSATAGDGAITLSWTAPTPFREVTSYEITVGDGTTTTEVAAGGGVTSKTISGLTNGSQYSFTVRSVNRVGESAPTAAVTATPSTRPSPPSNLEATPAAGAIALTWSAPTDDGGSAILDYTARVFASGDDPSVDTAVSTKTGSTSNVTFDTNDGLVNASAYDVYVSSRNANGSSVTDASVTAVVPGRPSRPLSVDAAGLVGSARVTWTAPSSDGGAPIASYVVSAYSVPGNTLVDRVVVGSTDRASEGLVLVDGTAYEVTVAASQGGSSSDVPTAVANMGSESARATVVAGRPRPPGAPQVSPAAGALTVTWSPVADVAGITVTHYKVRAVAGSTVTSSALNAASVCSASCSYSLGSLTNGTSYEVAVSAAVGSADGDFGLFGASTRATPRTTPGTPVDLATERGDSSIDVSWGPPTSDGGSAITGYEVTITGGATPVVTSVDATTSAVTVPNLANGTTYAVSVVATNAAGNSATAATGSQKAFTVPGAPTVTEIGPASTTVSTTKKASDGSVAVLTFASATNLVVGNIVDITGLGTSFDGVDIEITEVTTTPTHTISYAAQDESVVAEVSAVGTVRLAGIYLTWDAPNDGGDAIVAYNVSVTDGDNATTYIVKSSSVTLSNESTVATGATTSSCPFSSRTCTISKIESLDENESAVNVLFSNGNTYVVAVSATNAAGTGTSDAPSIIVGQPNMPTGVELTAAEGRFAACWADPVRVPSNRTIQSYRISAVRGDVTRTKTVTTAEVAASTACSSPKVGVEISEFDDGTAPQRGLTYSVAVAASVSSLERSPTFGGVSALSTVVPLGVSDAPAITGVVVADTSATITWSAPANTGGQSIIDYIVTSTPAGFGCTTVSLSCSVTGLSRGSTYAFQVVARNASGLSAGVSSQSFVVATTTTTTTPTVATSPTTSAPPSTTTPPVVAAGRPPSWVESTLRGAIGGKVLTSSTAKASVTYSVKSRRVTLWLRSGPRGGKAVVKMNGKTVRTVDLYSRVARTVKITVVAPPSKSAMSRLSVAVSTSKNRKSKGRTVVIDAVSPSASCGKGCLKNPSPPKF